ncbi:MAG TPA: S16 family serine protease [Nitrososphaera sp.]|nr:S16 family serine protease [Nitrososphaera sp.]
MRNSLLARPLTVIILAASVAISVGINIIQFQISRSAQDSISELQKENSQLREQLDAASSISGISSPDATAQNNTAHDDGNGQQERSLSFSNPLRSGAGSITAVAVKTVASSNGFFQTVSYEGAIMDIVVEIIENGQGRVLVNTEIPTGVDFQSSAKTAVQVAQDITGVDLSSSDIIFSITAKGDAEDLRAVDGGSAGAAMTVLLVSELQGNSTLNPNVLITGTINPDGTIGAVGGIYEKAEAAGSYGAHLFLVPEGQATYLSESCDESRQGPIIYRTCRSEPRPLSELTEERFGMRVVEVSTVREALEFFANMRE